MKWEYVPAVPLKDFDVEKSLANQARFTVLDPAVVETYTEAVKRGDQFPAGLPGNGPSRAEPPAAGSDAARASGVEAAWAASHRAAVGFLLGVSPASARSYATDLRDLFGFARRAGVPPLLLDRRGLDGYLRHLQVERGLAAATVVRRCSALAGYYRYAVQEGLLADDPMRRVRRPRLPDNAPTFSLDADHARALIAAAAAHSPRAHVLTTVLLVTGCRIGELLGADIADLGWDAGYRVLQVRRKGGARDSLVLPAPVADVVHSYVADRTAGQLLVTRTGARWDRHRGLPRPAPPRQGVAARSGRRRVPATRPAGRSHRPCRRCRDRPERHRGGGRAHPAGHHVAVRRTPPRGGPAPAAPPRANTRNAP